MYNFWDGVFGISSKIVAHRFGEKEDKMVQTDIICRVVRILHNNNLGTAFTVERNGVQFLVTAKHLFRKDNFPSFTSIELLINRNYQLFGVEVKYPINPQIDIAVMKLNQEQDLTPRYNTIYTTEGVILGQDVFFVGFPFEYEQLLQPFPGSDKPIPVVKKACMSAILQDETHSILLDGYNNPGFSGSPVCYKNARSTKTEMQILGVVSGYRNGKQPVFDENDNQTSFYVKENSGIILVSDIKYAIQIADNWG